ncbi:MAG: hypothetical protein AB7F43_02890 [Bacteriovoracia bacterium]
MTLSSKTALVAVGSASTQVCSVGAFARAESKALENVFNKVFVLEPTKIDKDIYKYPDFSQLPEHFSPDVVFFHAPGICDRYFPWSAVVNAIRIRKHFKNAKFVSVVHEYSEAPWSWKIRQIILAKISDALIVNSLADLEGLKKFHSNILRSRLGPTLYSPELIHSSIDTLAALIENKKQDLSKRHQLDPQKKWIVHAGLVTPGKGVDFLSKITPFLEEDELLIVMGGFGPKNKDRIFAEKVITSLRESLGNRFYFLPSPEDSEFKNFLFSADLVVLPYSEGLSERRSSFLSSMSCGSNVWTTTGRFSDPMGLLESGTHYIPVDLWLSERTDSSKKVGNSLKHALAEQKEQRLARRKKNLLWSKRFSWENRSKEIQDFLLPATKR